jgi:hypothetical protein
MADEKYGPDYVRCEQDIMAWLLTQVPVPVCAGLMFRIKDGDHRGAGPGLDRQWEIPVTIKVGNPIQMKYLHMLVRFEGGDLCFNDEGKYVVVPMAAPVDRVQAQLCEVQYVDVGLVSVGPPIRFQDNVRVTPLELVVHILLHGRTLCGFPTGIPIDWPEGNKYCSLHEAKEQANCPGCIERMPATMKDLAISEEARG